MEEIRLDNNPLSEEELSILREGLPTGAVITRAATSIGSNYIVGMDHVNTRTEPAYVGYTATSPFIGQSDNGNDLTHTLVNTTVDIPGDSWEYLIMLGGVQYKMKGTLFLSEEFTQMHLEIVSTHEQQDSSNKVKELEHELTMKKIKEMTL